MRVHIPQRERANDVIRSQRKLYNGTSLVLGPPGSGKTVALLQELQRRNVADGLTRYPLVANRTRAEAMWKEIMTDNARPHGQRLGIERTPFPVTVDEARGSKLTGSSIRELFIDDLEAILPYAFGFPKIGAISMTTTDDDPETTHFVVEGKDGGPSVEDIPWQCNVVVTDQTGAKYVAGSIFPVDSVETLAQKLEDLADLLREWGFAFPTPVNHDGQ